MSEIFLKKIEEIIPYKNNPRINDKAAEKVAESIKEFGFQNPIILDKESVIICGHTRLKAAVILGLNEVPCLIAANLSEEQVKAFRLADNKTAELAEWDDDVLITELRELDAGGFNIESLGWSEDQLGELLSHEDIEPQDDDYTEPDDIHVDVKLGDLIELGSHRVLCGDSTDKDSYGLIMQERKAVLYLSDPPYGVSYADKNEFLNAVDKGNRNQTKIENDHKTPEEMYQFWKDVFTPACQALANESSYYIFSPQGGDLLLLLLLQAVRDSGFQLKHILVWAKNNHVLGRCDYNYKHEPIVYGWKQKGSHKFYGNGEQLTSVWSYDKPLKNDLHPTMKPLPVLCNALLNSTIEGDLVLDNFLGSGSTLIASEQLNRVCCGIEIDPKYCQVIINRYKKYCEDNEEVFECKINGESYEG